MTHAEKILWMHSWCAKNDCQLTLEGEVGIGRECVGILVEGKYPDYKWYNNEWEVIDDNGEVWAPEGAYHKHECVAVLGRGKQAEAQLYDWLKWFDERHAVIEKGDQPMDRDLGLVGILLGRNRYARIVIGKRPK